MNIQLEHDNKNYWDTLYKNYSKTLPWNRSEVSPIVKDLSQIVHVDRFKVLDIGCGFGRHIDYYNNFECDITSIDISEEAIKLIKNKNVNLICDNFLTYHFNKKFNLILDINTSFLFSNSIKNKIVSKIYDLLYTGGFYLNESGIKQQSFDHIVSPKITIQSMKKLLKKFNIVSLKENVIVEKKEYGPYYVVDIIAKKQ